MKEDTDQPVEKNQSPHINSNQPSSQNQFQPGNTNMVTNYENPAISMPLTNAQSPHFPPFQSAQFSPYNNNQFAPPPPAIQQSPSSVASNFPLSPFAQMVPVDPYSPFIQPNQGPTNSQVPFIGPSAPAGPGLRPRTEAVSSDNNNNNNNRNPRVLDTGKSDKKSSLMPKEWRFLLSSLKPREGRSLGSLFGGLFGRESRMQGWFIELRIKSQS